MSNSRRTGMEPELGGDRQDPESARLHRIRILYQQAVATMSSNPAQAITLLEQVLDLDPNHTEARNFLNLLRDRARREEAPRRESPQVPTPTPPRQRSSTQRSSPRESTRPRWTTIPCLVLIVLLIAIPVVVITLNNQQQTAARSQANVVLPTNTPAPNCVDVPIDHLDYFDWSSKHNKIAYSYGYDLYDPIHLLDPSTKRETEIPLFTYSDEPLFFSPDGSKLAAGRTGDSDNNQVGIYDLETKEVIYSDPYQPYMVMGWMGNNTVVGIATTPDLDPYLVKWNITTNLVSQYDLPLPILANGPYHFIEPAINANGTKLAHSDEYSSPEYSIEVIDLNSGQHTNYPETEGADRLRWLDNNYIAYLNDGLSLLDTRTGNITEIAKAEYFVPFDKLSAGSSNNSSTIAVLLAPQYEQASICFYDIPEQ